MYYAYGRHIIYTIYSYAWGRSAARARLMRSHDHGQPLTFFMFENVLVHALLWLLKLLSTYQSGYISLVRTMRLIQIAPFSIRRPSTCDSSSEYIPSRATWCISVGNLTVSEAVQQDDKQSWLQGQ